MTIDDPKMIDMIGVDSTTGKFVLTICDHKDWTEVRGHLLALQEKINSYIAFIQSGQLKRHHPNLDGTPVYIDIVGKESMPPMGSAFLAKMNDVLSQLGIQVRFRKIRV
jgi:hypothetical protein